MSLKELLAEEEFKGRRSMELARAFFTSEAPHYSIHSYLEDQEKCAGSASGIRETEKRNPWYNLRDEVSTTSCRKKERTSVDTLIGKEKVDKVLEKVPTISRIWGRTSVDTLIGREKVDKVLEKIPTISRIRGRTSADTLIGRENVDQVLENGTGEKFERVSNRLNVDSSKDFLRNKIKLGEEEAEGYKDIHANEVSSNERSRGKYSDGLGEEEKTRRRSGNNSSSHLLGRNDSRRDSSRKCMKQPRISYSWSNNTRNRKSVGDRSRRRAEIEQNAAVPALDEVSVKAMISILSGYVKRLVKDEDFRATTRRYCFTLLNSMCIEEDLTTETKVISNLEQAIETVERAAQELATAKELEKASLQLSVITGLKLSDWQDGFTYGIPNSKLSGCAHLYLSVIYILQKKDRIAAKHILRVFCDSPFQARTILLPELWDNVFFPHLSPLKEWYNREADSVPETPGKARRQKLLQKVYNQFVDSGTYQFAAYYKDWLTVGVEAPSIPSIQFPPSAIQGDQPGGLESYYVQGVDQEVFFSDSLDVGNPTGPFPPQSAVSKRLYDVVSGPSQKPAANGVEDHTGEGKFDACIRSYEGSSIEEKQAPSWSSANVKHMVEDIQQDNASHPEEKPTAEEGWRFHLSSAPGEGDANDTVQNVPLHPAHTKNSETLLAIPNAKANELTLGRLAKSVFELQQTEGPDLELSASTFLTPKQDAPYPDYCADSMKKRSSDEETSQTFERATIMERFNAGGFISLLKITHMWSPPGKKTALLCISAAALYFALGAW